MQRVMSCSRKNRRLTFPCGCAPGVLAIILCSVAADVRAQGSVESDRAALMALYDAAGGPNWSDNANWGGDAPLRQWTGVITDSDGRVTNLFLPSNGLSGTLPAELGDLTKLEGLSLNVNALRGAIPAELGNLANLKEIYLVGNSLTGSVPAELGNLANLEKLYLAVNSFTGPIPAFAGWVNLEEMNLAANNFRGTIPAALGSLTSLTTLWLGNNDLTGPIPAELGNLMNLRFLLLANLDNAPSGGRNALSGPVPSTFGNLRALDTLWLQANRLEGELPASLTNLSLDSYLGDENQPTLRFEDNAGLCAPTDEAFQAWLNSLRFGYTGPVCGAVVPALPTLALMLLALMLVGAGLRARRSTVVWPK